MEGLYLYCVRVRRVNSGEIKLKGIDSGEEIKAVFFKDIEALASKIDLSKFNEKEIKDKLQGDPKWTEKNIRRHHDVIVEACKYSAVVPMRFGMIFKTKKSLTEMLKVHYKNFKGLFANFHNKQEWGVQIYLEREKFIKIIKQENKAIEKLEKEKSAMAEGRQWYMDKKIEEFIAAQFEEEVENKLQNVTRRLEDYCEQIVFCNFLPKEAMATGKDNIFNVACLIDNSKLDNFKKMLLETEKECNQIGAALVATGPWPPYNFVQVDEKK